jgi:putative ABC transport system permease protein
MVFWVTALGLYLLAKPNTNLPVPCTKMLEQFKKDFWLYQNDRCKEVNFEPLSEVYFSKVPGNGLKQNSKTFLMVLLAIVFSILGLAIINYMNLTVAQSGLRIKETAIRKLVGSSRKMLIYQYINESVLVCTVSFSLAVLLSFAGQSIFNGLFNSQLNLFDELNLKVISYALLAILLLGFISGIIPALIITRLNAIEVIKGSFRRKSKGVYSRMLIGFQYTVVIVLLMSSLMITKQTQFIQNHDLGYKSQNVLVMDFMVDRTQEAGLRDRLMSVPGVKGVSYVCGNPIDGGNNQSFT